MRQIRLWFAMVALVGLGARVSLGADVGVVPVDARGVPLNLDFEAGSLKDWTAQGDAFAGR